MVEDPFGSYPQLLLRQSLDQPFLGSFQVQDPNGQVVGWFLRSGAGLRVLMMNFVLQDAARRPVYEIRQPIVRGIAFNRPFALVDPTGVPVGNLSFGGWGSRRSLVRDGVPVLTAAISPWGWKPDFEVKAGAMTVGTVTIPNRFLVTPSHPGGIVMDFAPVSAPVPRSLVVAFVAFVALGRQVPQWPAAPK